MSSYLSATRILLLLVLSSLCLHARSDGESGYDFECLREEVPCGCGRENAHLSEPRVISGEAAVPYSWSMLVSIRLKGTDKHACGGTVLNESYVLTSATCVAQTYILGMTIAAGHHYASASNATIRQVDGVFIHPNYTGNASQYLNDIAILHLAQALDLGNDSYVSRSCIAQLLDFLPSPIYVPAVESMLAVVGWGTTSYEDQTEPALVQQALVYAANDSDSDCPVVEAEHDFQFCAGQERRDIGGEYELIREQRSNQTYAFVPFSSLYWYAVSCLIDSIA